MSALLARANDIRIVPICVCPLGWPEMEPNSGSFDQALYGGDDDRNTYGLPPLQAEGWETKRWSVAEHSGGALTGRASYEVCMGAAQVAPTAPTSGPQCAPASVPLQQYAAEIQEVSATLPGDPDSAPWSSASPRFTSYTSQPSWLRSSNPSAWAAPPVRMPSTPQPTSCDTLQQQNVSLCSAGSPQLSTASSPIAALHPTQVMAECTRAENTRASRVHAR